MYLNVKTAAHLLGSTIRVDALTKFLAEQGVQGCAITNAQLYQLPEFRSKMEKARLKAVYGLEVIVKDASNVTAPLFVYAMNKEGFDNLVKISSAVSTQDQPLLPIKWLKAYSAHLLAILPTYQGNWTQKATLVQQMKDLFGKNCLFGVTRTAGQPQANEVEVMNLAMEFHIPIVALHESYYLTSQDAFAYETLQAIKTGEKLTNLAPRETGYYLPTKAEMQQWFADKPQWLQAADAILSLCTVEFGKVVKHMPSYPLTEGLSSADKLTELAEAGLKVRLFGTYKTQQTIPQAYRERLDYELNVINNMSYADYFLIVADFMAFSKREGILTGPGRGSSASSIVAYALQITQVDPLKYGLLFERFLNPQRVSMPDIDIDFIDSRRHEVIQYVNQKYPNVAQIGTFGNLTMKAAGREVGRMFQMTDKELKQISVLLEKSRKETLMDAYNASKDLQSFVVESPRNKLWFDTALKIEGLPRNTSTHSAGVILTPEALVNYVPLQKGSENIYLTQWTMTEVEAEGVLKIDFLGLRNLSILEDVCNSLERTYGVQPTLETIPFDDAATFELLQKGYVEGIFQLESDGMRKSLMSIVPTEFIDIIAINALYRPGPMEFIKNYAARKLGQEQVTYLHPLLKPILEETYGIIVFQEQILQIARVFAGFTLAEADLLRRAIGKKKREVLEQQGQLFVEGAVRQGHDTQTAQQIYALIVKFAEYGFPKSHSTAYSFITYQMAYLKTHFPSHYYSALLNDASGDVKRKKVIFDEMRERGIQLLPIELGNSRFETCSENKAVRLGYHHIKGLVKVKLEQFTAVSPKADFFDYARAVGPDFDVDMAQLLIKAGAFDMMKDRATLLASIEEIKIHAEANDFFGFDEIPIYKAPLANYSYREGELEVLGFSVQAHPAMQKRPATIQQTFMNLKEGARVQVVGLLDTIKVIQTKKKEDMAFVGFSDEDTSISVTLFPRQYSASTLTVGQCYVITGKVEKKNGKFAIIADQLTPLK